MRFNEYQREAIKTALYPGAGSGRYESLSYAALGLSGEAGEIANKVKKVFRDDGGVLSEEKRQQIADELGDVLWYAAQVATELDIDLEDPAERNVIKLRDRKNRGVISGSGDNR